MSELISNRDNRATIRWKLLTSASALALTVAVSSITVAKAEDADRPLIWVELGGQAENIRGQGDVFAPAFLAANSGSPVLQKVTPLQAQKPPVLNFGEEGKISFQPEDSDWIFSAAIRYGRSGNTRHVDHQTNGTHFNKYRNGAPVGTAILTTADFANTHAHTLQSHAILDFSVGKDVGLGMFGRGSSSVLDFGVRFAQFTSHAAFEIRARPDLYLQKFQFAAFHLTIIEPHFHSYYATGHAARDFRGVGPALSWTASTPFAGNPQDGELTFDWGANASLLFGKQKARIQHQENDIYYPAHVAGGAHIQTGTQIYHHPSAGHPTDGHISDRSVTVPNVGGFAGLSLKWTNAKISFGYRADFFFGAMDTGIDAVKKSNMTFNGPYASISVGLGD